MRRPAAFETHGRLPRVNVGRLRRHPSITGRPDRRRLRRDAAVSLLRSAILLPVASYSCFAALNLEVLLDSRIHLAIGGAILHRSGRDRGFWTAGATPAVFKL